jgi:hypothetical protein
MTRMLIFAAVATLAVAATPAEARWWGPPVVVAPPPPFYPGPACHVRRERMCDAGGCRYRQVEDCD